MPGEIPRVSNKYKCLIISVTSVMLLFFKFYIEISRKKQPIANNKFTFINIYIIPPLLINNKFDINWKEKQLNYLHHFFFRAMQQRRV